MFLREPCTTNETITTLGEMDSRVDSNRGRSSLSQLDDADGEWFIY